MKNKGFSLLELLLYVSISAILLLVTSVFLSTLVSSRIKNQTMNEVEQQGVQVVQQMTQAIRNAQAVTSPSSGASGSSLTLSMAAASVNPTVFTVSSGGINVQEGVGAVLPLTNARITASGVSFTNLSRAGTPGSIRIQFTLTAVNPSGRNEYDYSKTFIGSATLYYP